MESNIKYLERYIAYTAQNFDPERAFDHLLPVLGEALQCDRIFLYLRSPHYRIGRVPFCWRSRNDVPEIYNAMWNVEPPKLAHQDPLFAAALKTEPTQFIENVETADPSVVNSHFEARNFGHRALIHAHLCHNGKLWGIFQPCVFHTPRRWSPSDRLLVHQVVYWFTPLAVKYVNQSINQDVLEAVHDR
ncbi:GAF domain-containing protein [Vacuolonema iberomarrocanum]|uniref:GAF domain-containing protein n=1 Tax=Vacuolonema iberomarrocanum TaxID=3454632 RepID=UPI003F6E34AF